MQELILRNSTINNCKASIPASYLFANVHTVDITNCSVFVSKTSLDNMFLLYHILKQKRDNEEFKIKHIVTDLAYEYKSKYGVTVSRGHAGHLTNLPDTDLPVDTMEASCLSRLRIFLRYFTCII